MNWVKAIPGDKSYPTNLPKTLESTVVRSTKTPLVFEEKYDKKPTKKVVSIIVTHQNRIKCFLNSFMKIKHSLGNTSIIELILKKVNNKIIYSIRLIYGGSTMSKHTLYFPTEDTKNKLYKFDEIQNQTMDFLGITPSDIPENTEVIFFLVRHGNAEHNQYKGVTKFQSLFRKDTLLTEDGIQQAKDAGKFLLEYIQKNNLNIKTIFASDLKRTRQTLSILVNEFSQIPTDIIVLPCAHELIYFDDKNCDKKMLREVRGVLAGENITTCDTICVVLGEDDQCCTIKTDKKKYDVNWDFYNKFYDGQKRQPTYVDENKYTCTNTNMIQQALNILKEQKVVYFFA